MENEEVGAVVHSCNIYLVDDNDIDKVRFQCCICMVDSKFQKSAVI